MTKMVFAVTGRGKTRGQKAAKTEVGSWVIGYWRPKIHFEVNVWNCFERRLRKLASAIREGDQLASSTLTDDAVEVVNGTSQSHLACGDCLTLVKALPDNIAHLVITDPPHNDRVPYLELSEFWNSILRMRVDFDREIAVSNAKERSKTTDKYDIAMTEFFAQAARILVPGGHLVVLFNARHADDWKIFDGLFSQRCSSNNSIRYLGYFPCEYSAGSVVQDNRKGSLKCDYALVFRRNGATSEKAAQTLALSGISGWSTDLPAKAAKRDRAFISIRR